MADTPIEPVTDKPKRAVTEKQKAALAKGRAKRRVIIEDSRDSSSGSENEDVHVQRRDNRRRAAAPTQANTESWVKWIWMGGIAFLFRLVLMWMQMPKAVSTDPRDVRPPEALPHRGQDVAGAASVHQTLEMEDPNAAVGHNQPVTLEPPISVGATAALPAEPEESYALSGGRLNTSGFGYA